MTKEILIVAGETSGDIHASNLIRNLKKLAGDISFFGIGGDRMEKEGVALIDRIEHLSIIGVSEVFSKMSHVRGAFRRVKGEAEKRRPILAILVDYPGFNLTLARALKKKNIPVVYYITPQIWAWGRSRARLLKKYVDKAIVILKFEENLLKGYGIDATFVGHPILDLEKKVIKTRGSFGLKEGKPVVALLPGSRNSEVKTLLPLMLETAGLIQKQKDTQFVLLKSSGVGAGLYEKALASSGLAVTEITDDTYSCLGCSDFVFTASGTATLETAIMERPMLITYKTSLLTMLCFKIFARTQNIGLVNIIAKKEVAPEILQYDAKPRRLAREILSFLNSREKMEKQLSEIKKVKDELGTEGASERAARLIKDFLSGRG